MLTTAAGAERGSRRQPTAAEAIDSSRQTGVADLLRQVRVAEHVLLVERLLDQEQVERVQPGQVASVGQGVRRVRVHLEQHLVAEPLAHRAHRLDVPAGLDLQLDPDVALVEVAADGVEQRGDAVHDPDRDPARDAVVDRAELACRSDRPSARSSASSTAISSAALAIRWPLNGASTSATACGVHRPGRDQAGTRKRRSTSAAASTYSEE